MLRDLDFGGKSYSCWMKCTTVEKYLTLALQQIAEIFIITSLVAITDKEMIILAVNF